MRPRYQDGVRATRAAHIAAAFGVLLTILSALPSHAVRAQGAETAPPPSREQADAQITSLLGRIETLLDEGHITSPLGGNASDVFSQVLVLSAFASPTGLRTMADFPKVLKQRAETEHTAGHMEASVRFEIFSEVVSSIIAAQEPRPSAHSEAIADATPGSNTTGTANPATRQAAATASASTDETAVRTPGQSSVANPPAAETGRNTVEPATQPDVRNPPPTASSLSTSAPVVPPTNRAAASPNAGLSPPPTLAVTRQASPPSPGNNPEAQPNAYRNAEPPKISEPDKIATRQPASPATAVAARDNAGTNGPARVPALPPSMIDALLKQGDAMLSIGDMSAARRLLTRAAESGSGKAAIELGDTYNPIFLAERGVLGPQGDAEAARAWYRKALAFGEPQARQRLIDLGGGAQADAVGSLNKR